MHEAALVDGLRRGRLEAQRGCYEQFGPRIYRLVLRLSRNEQDALDLTQETFLRAFAHAAAFDGKSGLGTWLYRVAVNEALQLLRRRATQQRHERGVWQARRGPRERESDSPDLEHALGQIEPEQRLVLLLKYQDGLSYDEIGQVLDCPGGTVASRLNRARAVLRAVLDAEPAGASDVFGRTETGRTRAAEASKAVTGGGAKGPKRHDVCG